VTVPADKSGKCSTFLNDCSGVCVDLQTDPKNCNACGIACKTGELCSKGVCTATCLDGTTKCGDRCADLETDPANCGACGTACAPGLLCAAGKCVGTCESAGLATCSLATGSADAGVVDAGDAGDAGAGPILSFGCADLSKDANNCGACGVKCAMAQTCSNGSCCAAGRTGCGGACVDLLADANNCGACGVQCAMGQSCFQGGCIKCAANEVLFNNRCHYLDGSGGTCMNGYSLGPEASLAQVAPQFVGKTYKNQVSGNCCVRTASATMNYGMGPSCNAPGPFKPGEPGPGLAGCTNVPAGTFVTQLTFCQSN
jgi:hypothetical protein